MARQKYGNAASGATRGGKAASGASACSKAPSGVQPAAKAAQGSFKLCDRRRGRSTMQVCGGTWRAWSKQDCSQWRPRQPAAPGELCGVKSHARCRAIWASCTDPTRLIYVLEYSRRTIWVQGLFRERHWISPEHQDASISEIEGLKKRKQFEGMVFSAPTSIEIVDKYKRHVKRILKKFNDGPRWRRLRNKDKAIKQGGKVVGVKKKLVWRRLQKKVPPSGGKDASKLSPSVSQGEPIHPPGDMPASGGIERDLKQILDRAFKPSSKVDMQIPRSCTPAAVYNTERSYMQPTSQCSAADIPWLPQEAAAWLYNATHYAIPLLQTLLWTQKAFDSKGCYVDVPSNTPASGGQLAAWHGTELGSRRDRALIAMF